jgi:hypothetical protein
MDERPRTILVVRAGREVQAVLAARLHQRSLEIAMTPIPTNLLTRQGSAERWQTIRQAMNSWGPTIRLCMILFVVQIPLDIGTVVWLVTYLATK